MRKELGSTRAFACPDRRLPDRKGRAIQSLNDGSLERAPVSGNGADQGARERRRSPSQLRTAVRIALSLLFILLASQNHSWSQQTKPEDPFGKPLQRPVVGGAVVFHEKSKLPLPDGFKVLYEQTFENEAALRNFVFTDAKAWKLSTDEKGAALELVAQSKYEPKVRSPFNIALLADKVFGDFIIEVDLIQTGKEYGHRDMVLVFGLQDPAKFYYAHIATAADDHAHNIFIVNDQPRTKIAKESTRGVNWGLNVWHKARLERKLSDGSIKVYFDDLSKPIMVAEDKTFGPGYIGFGSFDDTGKVDNIRIWGRSVETKRTEFFTRP